MSCNTTFKKNLSVKSLEQLKDYFDFVELEELEKYLVLTLKNEVKRQDTVIKFEVWLQVKIAYPSGQYKDGLEYVSTQILKWIDRLLNFEKPHKQKISQLSLFDDEIVEEDSRPVRPDSSEEKSWAKYNAEEKKYNLKQLDKFSFFELCPLSGYTYGTYMDIDFLKYLPKTNKEMIELVKQAIIKGVSSKAGYGRFDDYWWDDEYNWMTRDGALSDYEIITRVKNLVRLYLVPYQRERTVSVDLSYSHWIFDTKIDHRFWFDGRKINTNGGHWVKEQDLPTYELYDLEFIEWLREFFNIPYAEMKSDEEILKENLNRTLESILWYKKEEYDLLNRIKTFKDWKYFKADFIGFMKSNNLETNGGSGGYNVDGYSYSFNGFGKVPELYIKQDIAAREMANRTIDRLWEHSDKDAVVFHIKGDEFFKLAHELNTKNTRPIQTTLFDF